MKYAVLIVFLIMCFYLTGIQNWNIYTNTSHIYDVEIIDNKIAIATWGGLINYYLDSHEFGDVLRTTDGLSNNVIQSVSYNDYNEVLYIATRGGGINRLRDGLFLTPVNQIIGLPSDNVGLIAHSDSLLFAATNHGLSMFMDLEEFPFPLMINHFTTQNGLLSNSINDLVVREGYLYLATENGFNAVNLQGLQNPENWLSFLEGQRVLSVSVNDINMTMATENGVIVIEDFIDIDHDNFQYTTYNNANNPKLIKDDFIRKILIDNQNNIWFTYGHWIEEEQSVNNQIGTAISVLKNDGQIFHWTSGNSELTTNDVMGFYEVDDRVFIVTWGEGLFFWDENQWVQAVSNSVVSNKITQMIFDNEQQLWVCTGAVGSLDRLSSGVGVFDGKEWRSYKADSSPLLSNNISIISVDENNRKWFGSWERGVLVYDETVDSWNHLSTSNALITNQVGGINKAPDGSMWVSCFGTQTSQGSMTIFDDNLNPIHNFDILSPLHYNDVVKVFFGLDKIYFGTFYSGLRIFNGTSYPTQPPTNWLSAPFSDLNNVYVNDIDSRIISGGEEVWVASDQGLFSYNSRDNTWFRYTVNIKRLIYQNNQWQNHQLYFVDEERLFSAIPTSPTALFVDPFDRVWIGTRQAGISVYNPQTDRFQNFTKSNSPLLDNNITSFAYEPYGGVLYIATAEGLNSVEIGRQFKQETKLSEIVVYPNPFYPENGINLTIKHKDDTNMPLGRNYLNIYDLNGRLIRKIEENMFFQFSWDGNNEYGQKCGSGIYFFVISTSTGKTEKGTIVLIR